MGLPSTLPSLLPTPEPYIPHCYITSPIYTRDLLTIYREMGDTVTLWPSLVTQVVSHIMALSYTFIITRDNVQVQVYSGWVRLLCIGAIGLLISGVSKHLSALLDLMGCSEWREPVWVMLCNIVVFSCVHSIYLIATAEPQLVSGASPSRGSFPDPEELDRGDYTVSLVIKHEANQTRLMNNTRKEEDHRAIARRVSPFLRTLGEGLDDLLGLRGRDEGGGDWMSRGASPLADFWDFSAPPTYRSPSGSRRSTGDESGGDTTSCVRPWISNPAFDTNGTGNTTTSNRSGRQRGENPYPGGPAACRGGSLGITKHSKKLPFIYGISEKQTFISTTVHYAYCKPYHKPYDG
ncbi:hypothetical protein C7212DRAFT_361217 [Tuber magnatum]|uniref:Uncharacterized protein n=1 Tax=Tuber magnatum TaxID=42249 RepID=A0A317T499_9PEZI|nr:hypothetical protein C7212DRAFT_361217 [Tuber magnatum]